MQERGARKRCFFHEETMLSMLFIDNPPPSPAVSQQNDEMMISEQISPRTFMGMNENVAAISNVAIEDISDGDFEDDQPYVIVDLILSNSNAENDEELKTECSVSLCNYNAATGWKQLTKHCIRRHPGINLPNSRLSKNFHPQELMVSSFLPTVTNGPCGMLIQSLCYICNKSYRMNSEKWLKHFIAHTGK